MKNVLLIAALFIFIGACNDNSNEVTGEIIESSDEQISATKSPILFFASDTLALMKEANGGDVEAQYHLGIAFYELKEFDKAKLWFMKVVDLDFKPAKKHYASLLNEGIYSFRDGRKAMELYKSLAENGDIESLRFLAEESYNQEEQLKWYKQLVKYDDLEAINIVAGYYANSMKIPQAAELYKKAILLGDWEAAEKLIRAYLYSNKKSDAYAWALLLNLRGDGLIKGQLFNDMNTAGIIEAQEKCKELMLQY